MKTVMVTGGTGYIGAWTVKKLLEKGYTVRLMVRDTTNTKKTKHLTQIADKAKGTLEIHQGNLLQEGSYDDAAEGCDAVIHMASPFTLRFEDAKKELLEPALEGTRNVLNAASQAKSIKKIVLTSSVAAVHGDTIDMKEKKLEQFDESHFNDTSSATHQPYSYSKLIAEKEAWKIAEAQDQWSLVVMNPSFVLGPSLSASSDSESIQFIKDMLSGKFRMGAPRLAFGFVDVRDVANAHIAGLEKDEAQGRHILAERTGWVQDIAQIIKEEYGGKYKLPLMVAPKFLLYIIGGMFNLPASFVKRNVGYPLELSTEKSKKKLGMEYTNLKTTVKDMVEQMEQDGVLEKKK